MNKNSIGSTSFYIIAKVHKKYKPTISLLTLYNIETWMKILWIRWPTCAQLKNNCVDRSKQLLILSYHGFISDNFGRRDKQELYGVKYYLLQLWLTKLPKLDTDIWAVQDCSCEISEAQLASLSWPCISS